MMPDRLDELPPDFLYGVLKMLNIDYGEFMCRLFNDKPHEIIMYTRIYMLYHDNKRYVDSDKN